MATKEHSTHKMGLPPRLHIRSDRYGSKATKDKQLSFNNASHICDCQSYRVKPTTFRGFNRTIIAQGVKIKGTA